MKTIRDFNNAHDAAKTIREDIEKLMGFLDAHMPRGDAWSMAETLSHIRSELVDIARFTAGFESSEMVVALVDEFELEE